MSVYCLVLCTLLANLCYGQQGEKMTARELFYAPVKAAATETKPPAGAPQKQARKQVAATKKPKTALPETRPPATTAGNASASQNAPPRMPGGATLQYAAYSGAPLGLRYSILKRAGDRFEEVDADTVFHAGDSIKVSVESNDRAYLYVVTRGTSGSWQVLFPSAEIQAGSNVVERDRQHQVPPAGGRFTFDEHPGTERLFLVLSRKPEQDLDGLIYSLTPGSAPAEAPRNKQVLIAQNTPGIDDALLNRIRSNFQARDLVFEKVDEKTAGDRKEKAIYIVNPDSNPDARLIADISLRHE